MVLLATLFLAAVIFLLRWGLRHRPPPGYWIKAGMALLLLAPVCLFGLVPIGIGWIGPSLVGTRGDESFYAGPWISEDGTWIIQVRRQSNQPVVSPPQGIRPIADYKRELLSEDGFRLSSYLVPPEGVEAKISVVLVHGLFRGGLELESIATMFRDLGAEVLMLELRDHGGSDRGIFTFGRDESLDVIAAVEWLRSQGRQQIVLFGISLGSAVATLACDRLQGIAGLVLDAPMDDLLKTAHRVLGSTQVNIPQPFRSIILTAMEWRMGMSLSEVKPKQCLARLPMDMPVLLIGGERDRRMPPEVVQGIFDGLATRDDLKEIWIRPGSGHGSVSDDDPQGYRQRLTRFLAKLR